MHGLRSSVGKAFESSKSLAVTHTARLCVGKVTHGMTEGSCIDVEVDLRCQHLRLATWIGVDSERVRVSLRHMQRYECI